MDTYEEEAHREELLEAEVALKKANRERDEARVIAISAESRHDAFGLAHMWGVSMIGADGRGGVHEKAGDAKRRLLKGAE